MINYSDEVIKILKVSEKECKELNHAFVGTEHVILAILNTNNNIKDLFNSKNIFYDDFKKRLISLTGKVKSSNMFLVYTPLIKRIIINIKSDNVTLHDFMISMFEEGEGIALNILDSMKLDLSSFYKLIKSGADENHFGINLNKEALNNRLNPVIGRDREINQLIEILSKKNKCNPLLIGDAGVGKTAIVEGLAIKIVNKEVPDFMLNKIIISISLSSLVSGTKYRGEFEEKLHNIINKFENSNNIIFIDEIHTIVGAGGAEGAIDASNILKPYLARNSIKCIGATTTDEYKKSISKDKALNRRFEYIKVIEPSIKETKEILYKIKSTYEAYHNIKISVNQIDELVDLTDKYITNKKNPDKSIDVLDEVCVKTKIYDYSSNIKKLNILLNKTIKEKEYYLSINDFNNAKKYKTKEKYLCNRIKNYKPCISNKTIIESINSRKNIISNSVGFSINV